MIKIKPEEVKPLTQFIYGLSGIQVDPKKTYLFETRLSPLVESYRVGSYTDLIRAAKQDAAKVIQNKIIDAISTNETLFFRDTSPFEVLQHKILPDLIDMRQSKASGLFRPTIRIWSAACSTGQEVYSIAIVLRELLGDVNAYNIKLLGTDISDAVIAQASYGNYNKFEIERGLPIDKLNRYFAPNGNYWKIKDEIRTMATFRKLNLMQPFAMGGKFDIIFCRNVAIYFTLSDRKKLYDKLATVLEPDGYLLIGASESLVGLTDRFAPKRHIRTVFYQPQNSHRA